MDDDRVRTVHLDPAGTLWVGTPHGLARRASPRAGRGSGRTFRRWASAAIPGDVRAILTHPDGRVWVGTDGEGVLEAEAVW